MYPHYMIIDPIDAAGDDGSTGRIRISMERMDDMAKPAHGNDSQAILNRIAPRFGSLDEAVAWYHSEPLPGHSGRTAAELTAQGRAEEVLAYIDAVDAGVHA